MQDFLQPLAKLCGLMVTNGNIQTPKHKHLNNPTTPKNTQRGRVEATLFGCPRTPNT